jgi:hypothetical protein
MAIAILAACAPRPISQGSEPVEFNTSPYVARGETVVTPDRESVELYRVVLRFYRPGPGRARWLDRALLPSEPGAMGLSLDTSLAALLVETQGNAFCVLEEKQECRGRESGGVLRISPVYQVATDQARIIVEFTGVEPYGPAHAGSQAFLLSRNDRGWRIVSRAPARSAS